MVSGLVIFDLDGTLLRERTVCEVLAAGLGQLPRMQEIEKLASEQELAAARVEMAQWYRTVSQAELLSFLEDAKLAPGADEGIALLRAAGFEVGIASLTLQAAVARFAFRFGVSRFIGTAIHDDGSIAHIWPRDKAAWLRRTANDLGLDLARVAAVGDSHGDLPMLEAAGVKIHVGASTIDIDGCHHAPAADIRDVARKIIEELSPGFR